MPACLNLVVVAVERVKYRNIHVMAYELHAVMFLLQSLSEIFIYHSSGLNSVLECSLHGSIPSRKCFSWCFKL
jgi:hypothetical protein